IRLELRSHVVEQVFFAQLEKVPAGEKRGKVILDQPAARLFIARLEGRPVALVPGAQVGVERDQLRPFCGVSEGSERERGVDLLGDLFGSALVPLRRANPLLLPPALEVGHDPPRAFEPTHLRRHCYFPRRGGMYWTPSRPTMVATEPLRSAAISSSASICVPSKSSEYRRAFSISALRPAPSRSPPQVPFFFRAATQQIVG